MECEKISLATTSDLVKFREDLAQTHVRTAVTKNIVNAMITRQSRTLKAAGSSSRTVSENTLLAWIESESVYVSGSMWDYEELTEVPDQVVCRVLFHNKAQNTIDFHLCRRVLAGRNQILHLAVQPKSVEGPQRSGKIHRMQN